MYNLAQMLAKSMAGEESEKEAAEAADEFELDDEDASELALDLPHSMVPDTAEETEALVPQGARASRARTRRGRRGRGWRRGPR